MQTSARKSYGFTLIELLIVISIVGILSAILLAVINPSKLRAKARDSRRVSELKSIQSAVELYYLDKKQYPPTGSGNPPWIVVNGGTDALSSLLVGPYIQSIPLDPLYNPSGAQVTDPCNSPTNYRFNYKSDGSYYMLTAQVEVDSSAGDLSCENLTRFSGGSCNLFCIGFENKAS